MAPVLWRSALAKSEGIRSTCFPAHGSLPLPTEAPLCHSLQAGFHHAALPDQLPDPAHIADGPNAVRLSRRESK
jgi:hypothetical protein